jgi:oligopeptide transport system ATP-binding protein
LSSSVINPPSFQADENGEPLFAISDLHVAFKTAQGIVNAVNGVSFEVHTGETLGIVGESGSGKTVSMLAAMGLVPIPPGSIKGSIRFEGQELLSMDEPHRRKIRGSRMAMVFQDPMTSLNPVLTIGHQVSETLRLHLNLDEMQAREKAIELLTSVGIPDAERRYTDYPHRLSGGMRQRVMIAIGLACHPQLLIADEPTTALDVTIQAQIIQLIRQLKANFGMTVIWITHDFGVIAGLADRVIVMYAGHVVEMGTVDEIFYRPQHPYTLGLLRAVPRLDEERPQKLEQIEGSPPLGGSSGPGCCFYPRCRFSIDKCKTEAPLLRFDEGKSHLRACWVDLPRVDA